METKNQIQTLNSPTQTSQSLKSTQSKFVLITYIDRINLFSDIFINYYKQVFDTQEFIFMVPCKEEEKLKGYLRSYGFTDDNFLSNEKSRKNFGYGEQTPRQNFLKTYYLSQGYIVVYADMDELIYHPDFKSFITKSPHELFCATGVQIIQHDTEKPLDITQPIYKQRRYGNYDPNYSKVCVLKKDFFWTPGRHNKGTVPVETSLWIFDIGRVCKELMLENNKKNVSLYQGVYPRYKLCTIEEVEKEYNSWLKRVDLLPKEFLEGALF